MTWETDQTPAEQELHPLVAFSWLVKTGRAEPATWTAEHGWELRLREGSDSLGQAALEIAQGKEPALLSVVYERTADVATLSGVVFAHISEQAIELFESDEQLPLVH